MNVHERRCSIPDCPRPVRSRGYCSRHYKSAWRAEHPRGQATVSAEEGDEICRMVLQLVKAIREDHKPHIRPAPEPVHASPVYRQYEAYMRAAAPAGPAPGPVEAA